MDDFELAKALFKQPKDTKTARIVSGTAYTDSADGSVQVNIDGSVFELPTNVSVKDGDTVQVTLSDRSPVVTGVVGRGDEIAAIAQEANDVATATNQHFWDDASGIHVSTDEHDAAGERNILINSLGILLRKFSNTLVSITESAIAFFDGGGDCTASFGASGSVIGKEANNECRMELTSDGMVMLNRDGVGADNTFAEIGYGDVLDGNGNQLTAPYYTFGKRNSSWGVGELSVAEGLSAAEGQYSHAEGKSTATGAASHAEGNGAASGNQSHAEGNDTQAGGDYSHAEGEMSRAGGKWSHAQNYYTIASSSAQTALGKFNIEDNADAYALIVGNGTANNARSNAFMVAWNGDIVAAGDVYDGNGNSIAAAMGGGGGCDLIYDTPLYWWDSGSISGTDSGSDDPSRAGMGYGELTASIEDYDLLVIHFKAGDTNSLNNTRLTHVLPVGAVEYLSGSQIDSGTKAQEFMYLYPAANPSWFIDVAYGFTDATHVYAKRRTYGNIRYWNIDKIYGIKF